MSDDPLHAHDHDADARRLGWALVITATFMVVEVVGGTLSGSLALIADAGHMLTDAASLALAWGAARLTSQGTHAHEALGDHRPQVVAAFVNSLALVGVVAWIAWEALERLREPQPIAGGTMLGIALLGLAANVAVLYVLRSDEPDANINISAARLHVIGDLLGSVGATIAALVIMGSGWTPVDPLLSLLVAVLIARSAWVLLRRSSRLLFSNSGPDRAR